MSPFEWMRDLDSYVQGEHFFIHSLSLSGTRTSSLSHNLVLVFVSFRGGRDKYALLPEAFKGIKQIGVIGWGSQVGSLISDDRLTECGWLRTRPRCHHPSPSR